MDTEQNDALKEKRRASLLRYQSVLLALASSPASDFDSFVARVLRADAEVLGVDRVGFWRFERNPDSIRCTALYDRSAVTPFEGRILLRSEIPTYFDALQRDLVISTPDAREDARTAELRDGYLVVRGITSMLDVPVWSHNELAGVVCHEHVGEARAWSSQEEAFAFSIGQLLSAAMEADARGQAERALWESEEHLRLFSSTITDYTLVRLTPSGTIFTGPERIRIGADSAELQGEDLSIFFPREDAAAGEHRRALQVAEKEGRFEEERWLVRRDGTRFWAHVVIFPVRDRLSRLRGFVQIARDLTAERLAAQNAALLEQTRAAEARARLLANLSAALGGMLEGEKNVSPLNMLLGAGIADGVTFHVEQSHEGGARLAPIFADDAELPRKTLVEAWAKRCLDEEVCKAAFNTAVMAKRAQRFSKPPDLGAEESLGYREAIVAPAMVKDRVVGVLTLFRRAPQPFSEPEVALAEEVAQRVAFCVDNSRLFRLSKEAVQVRDVFLSVAAHELRTPIAALLLSLQSWVRDHEQKIASPETEHKQLQLALRQTRRLGMLVDELLEVSRIGTGAVALQRQRMDLSALANEVVKGLTAQATRAGTALIIESDGPIEGTWDPLRVEQVLSNLVTNAIKFGGGRPVEVRVRQDGQTAILEVTDHGIGIAPKERSRIFGRFERAVSARHFGGLGLGLYIVRELAEAHGGTVSVRSEVGQGSTFTVRLPRFPPASVETPSVH